jgi:hypothetical protein
MKFDDIKKRNAEQIAKYPGSTLLFIPTILADLAVGHGLSIDGYLITTWQYEPGPEMVYDVEVGDIRRAPMRPLTRISHPPMRIGAANQLNLVCQQQVRLIRGSSPMLTDCSPTEMDFGRAGGRRVVADFDGGYGDSALY